MEEKNILRRSILESVEESLADAVNFLAVLAIARTVFEEQRGVGCELRFVPSIPNGVADVYSDTHGWENTVTALRKTVQKMDEDPNQCLVALGDMVAAFGSHQHEGLLLFLIPAIKYPDRVFLLKGNCDQDKTIMTAEGLADQTYRKAGFGMEFYYEIAGRVAETLSMLPSWLSFGNGLLATHGGPIRPVEALYSLSLPEPILDLWGNFESGIPGLETPMSSRGTEYTRAFGPNRVGHLLAKTEKAALVRGHQKLPGVKGKGFQIDCDGKMATFMSGWQKGKVDKPRKLVVSLDAPFLGFTPDMFVEI